MEEYFFRVVVVVELKVAHVIVEEMVDIFDVDEEVVQPVDVVEEVVQELIEMAKESFAVLYSFLHVNDVVSWNWYSPDAFRNQDLSYLRVVSD